MRQGGERWIERVCVWGVCGLAAAAVVDSVMNFWAHEKDLVVNYKGK